MGRERACGHMAEPALRLAGLVRTFGSVTAVDGLDLEVREGEVLGFLGPNGAGKTTTIRMVAGLLAPTRGTIEVFGKRVGPRAKARSLVGLCPQENVLYPELSSRENLEFAAALYGVPRSLRRARSDGLLSRLGLAEKATTRASALSGGMKRRLTLALALVHDPPLVVLDEPEAGLDPQTRIAVRAFIRSLKSERTVVLTTHNMDEVDRLADRVAIVDRGKLVALGAPEDLKRAHGEGDNLEITVAGEAESARSSLERAGYAGATATGSTVALRGAGLARSFPQILAAVRESGLDVVDVRYRGSSLEDVFIELTGRGLRE